MNELSRFIVATCLLLASACSAAAQNSSLMRPPTSVPGYRSPTNAPPPPFPPAPPEPRPAIARRYDPWAQAGPSPGYDQARERSSDGYAATQPDYYGGPDPYDAGAQGYDPYQRVPRPAVSLNEASWTYQPAPPVRVYRTNDVITIRGDEITRMMAEGAAFNRKRTLSEVILTDWVRLKDFRLRPDPQDEGDPASPWNRRTTFARNRCWNRGSR